MGPTSALALMNTPLLARCRGQTSQWSKCWQRFHPFPTLLASARVFTLIQPLQLTGIDQVATSFGLSLIILACISVFVTLVVVVRSTQCQWTVDPCKSVLELRVFALGRVPVLPAVRLDLGRVVSIHRTKARDLFAPSWTLGWPWGRPSVILRLRGRLLPIVAAVRDPDSLIEAVSGHRHPARGG